MHLRRAQSVKRRVQSVRIESQQGPLALARSYTIGLGSLGSRDSLLPLVDETIGHPSEISVAVPSQKERHGIIGGFAQFFDVLAGAKILSSMLIFLPLGFAARWTGQSDGIIFICNFLGIVPLAWLIGNSTEDLAAVTGEVVGGLLNATFGNVVEMLLCIASVRSGQLVLTKCTLLGSMLSNLLLVMGCSCLCGGIVHRTQRFTEAGANVQVVMLLLSVMALAMPTGYADTMGDQDARVHEAVVHMSRYLSILLLFAYLLYLYFQIVTHKDLFGTESEEDEPADMNPVCAATVLAGCTIICAISTEYLIDSIRGTVDELGLTQEFIGIILLPIIGNAAEHYTAITVALVDKMDLALGVAVGSSCQMALLVAPFTVMVGWAVGQDMTLDFHAFQLLILLGSVLVVSSVLWSKATHWLYGAMMIIAYLAVAIVYLCESKGVSTFEDRQILTPPLGPLHH
eukprot:TRINITY_DN7014_c0_g1_i1.p1 TRINITY_DN7014_c0_g1~~TRINITY_DN7014_c0_g1_i1.p1  ORF type:complete len:457 (-),score=48.93 TRINITY_DN7014_c0_g1_i1:663-2033(-)